MKNYFRQLLLAIIVLLIPLLISSNEARAAGFANMSSMSTVREWHTSTLLGNGKILVAGGYISGGAFQASAELFDPATGKYGATGAMTTPRGYHTATMLPNGKVLVVGGSIGASETNTAELYDPAAGTFSATGSMTAARRNHTATLLQNGKVLIAGGITTGSTYLASAELYDPSSGLFTAASGSLATARANHTATLLADGTVLIAGGANGVALSSAELFDPVGGNFTATTGTLGSVRTSHSATLLADGKVLIAGGGTGVVQLNTAEIFDPSLGTFAGTGNLSNMRQQHTANLLPDGSVLVTGGYQGSVMYTDTAERYYPTFGSFSSAGNMSSARSAHTATQMPGGRVIIVGGTNGFTSQSSTEAFDPSVGVYTATAGGLTAARNDHTSTLLPDGKVLIAGGVVYETATYLNSAELYDPVAKGFSPAAALAGARANHTATLLPGGKVLIAGGYDGITMLDGAELFDPGAGTFSATGIMTVGRQYHSAVLLSNGKVLVAGGDNASVYLDNSELYDPASGLFTATGPLGTPRTYQSATMIPGGKVLVTGGFNGSSLSSAELFDPLTNSYSPTGSMAAARHHHSSTLLPNGKVLIVGGYDVNSAELYDPATGVFTPTGALATARYLHTAMLLPNGTVLISGGFNSGSSALSSSEIYDPATGTFSGSASLSTGRREQRAALLTDGAVLITGGIDTLGYAQSSAELFDPGLGTMAGRKPALLPVTMNQTLPLFLTLTGTGFQGDSEASGGGSNGSATNYPLLQLRRLDNGMTSFVASNSGIPWSATSLTSSTVAAVAGQYLATVFVNGIGSDAVLVTINPQLSRAPVSGDFGSVLVGTNSAPTPFTITNTGTVTLTVTGIAVKTAGTFSISNDLCTSATLAPSDQCTVSATYSPVFAQGVEKNSLIITTDVSGWSYDIPLSGSGLDTTPPADGTVSAAPGNARADLFWSGFSDSGSGIAYYLLASGVTPPANCTAGVKVYIGTSYRDSALANDIQRFYRVCAVDNSGNISAGATGSVTPSAGTTYTLSVTKSGDAAGSGTVTSDVGGISCGTGAGCSAEILNATKVTLTATAPNFAGWSGACSGADTTCSVTMDVAKSVNADFSTSAITGVSTWTNTYGDATSNNFSSTIVTSDGGSISAGKTYSSPNFLGWLVKHAADGSVLWQNTYGEGELSSVQQTLDGGYIAAGYQSANSGDAWIVKVNADGSPAWQHSYGTALYYDVLTSIVQDSNGDYVAAGSAHGAGWMFKISNDGSSVLWEKTFAEAGEQSSTITSIKKTPDGGVVAAGTITYTGWATDGLIIKLDSSGAVLWNTKYRNADTGTNYINDLKAIDLTADGGYIASGRVQPNAATSDGWLLKTDSSGNILWSKNYGLINATINGYETFSAVRQTSDSAFIAAGSTSVSGGGGGWVVKVNSASGAIVWQNTYGLASSESINAIDFPADGGFLAGGTTNSFGRGLEDGWLLKLGASGEVSGCGAELIAVPTDAAAQALPFNTMAYSPVIGSSGGSYAVPANTTLSTSALPLGVCVPKIFASPATVGFGLFHVGTSAPSELVTLTNSGLSPLIFEQLAVNGANPEDFALFGNTCSGSLAPGASCTMTATFTPQSGGNHSAGVQVQSNAANSPLLNVGLSGSGGYTLTITNPGAFGIIDGGVCGDGCELNCGGASGYACTRLYTSGTVLNLTQTPLAGSVFTGWTDAGAACLGSGPCGLTVGAADMTLGGGFCNAGTFSISPLFNPAIFQTSTGSFTLTASGACIGWTAGSSSPWISLTSGANGVNGTNIPVVYSVAAGPELRGSIVAADQKFSLLRTGNGGLDSSFNYQPASGFGYVTLAAALGSASQFSVYATALQSDGKIVVTGYESPNGIAKNLFVARFNPDGSKDTGFAVNAVSAGSSGLFVYSSPNGLSVGTGLVLQTISSEERIVVAGVRKNSTLYPNADEIVVLRLDSAGVPDSTFGAAGFASYSSGTTTSTDLYVDKASAVAIDSGNNIVVAGSTESSVGPYQGALLVRFTSAGALDTGLFNGTGISTYSSGTAADNYTALAVLGDNSIVAAGKTSIAGYDKLLMTKTTAGGVLQTTGFGTGGVVTYAHGANSHDSAAALKVQPDGKLVVAGSSTADALLLRYLADGSLDAGFNSLGAVPGVASYAGAIASGVALQTNGKIVVAGSAYNLSNDVVALRYNSDGTLDSSFGAGGIVVFDGPSESNDGTSSVLVDADGNALIAGTVFDVVNYKEDGLLLRLTKTTPVITWSNPADITYGTALDATQLNATANVAGTFTYTPAGGTILNAGAGQSLSVTFTPADTVNYTSPAAMVVINVAKASQAISFGTAPSLTYGGGTGSVSATGGASGNPVTFSSLTTGVCTISGTTVTPVAAGTCTIAADQAGTTDFDAAPQATQNITVAKAALTITAAAKGKVYGTADPALTYSVTGLVAPDTMSGSLSRVAGENVGSYAIGLGTVAVSAPANYSVSYTGDNLTIGAAPLTITAAAKSKTYGTVDPVLTYTVTGLVAPDTMSGSLTRVAGENVGAYAIGQGTVAVSAPGNYSVSYTGDNLTIGAAPLTITAVAMSKIYGTVDPALTYTVTGLVAPDTMSGSLNRAVGENVGLYAIGQGTVAVSAPGNYSVTYTGDNLTISAAPLTITAAAMSKIYGTVDPALTYSVTGLVAPDTMSGSLSRAAGENVGVYAIGQGTVAVSAPGNYTVTYTGDNLTIGAAPLTIISAAKSKTYGTVDPALTYTVTGLVAPDTMSGSLSRVAGENVGVYAIGQGTVAVSAPGNYTVTYTGDNLTIGAAPLTIIAAAKSKTYGTVDPALTYSVTGLIAPDTMSGSLSRAAGENAGAYAIGQGTVAVSVPGNYTVTYTGDNLTIGAAPLTITAAAKGKVYGAVDPALTFSVTGLVAPDTMSGSLSRAPGENAGVYAISQGTVAVSAPGNYSVTYTGDNLAISAAPLTITATAKNKTYGTADPMLTYSVTGLVAPDTMSGSLNRATGENVGAYAIGQGTVAVSAPTNYSVSYTGDNLAISAAPLTITAAATSKTYGTADPALTYSVTGLVAPDTMSGSLSRAAGENAGAYAIGQGTVAVSAPGNYSVSYTGDNLTIGSAPLTITAAAKNKTYGTADPALTYSVTGLIAPDTMSGSLSRAVGENVGSYVIGQGTVAVSAPTNYSVTYTGDNLTISAAPLTITAAAKNKTYGTVDPALTYSVTGLVVPDTMSGSLSRALGENVGVYAIGQGTVAVSAPTNYSVSYTGANLTIDALPPDQVTTGTDGRTTVPMTVSAAGANLILGAGTLLTDASGAPISGTLTVTASVMNSIGALPTNTATAQTSDGKILSVLGNSIDITISAGASTVKTIYLPMIVNLPLAPTFASPNDSVSYYSFDGTKWQLEGIAVVKADNSVDLSVGHLSVWAVASFKAAAVLPFSENFDLGALPASWALLPNNGTEDWTFDTTGNATGGNGWFAKIGTYSWANSELRTPALDISAATKPALEFKTIYTGGPDTLTVDVSTDDGVNWTNVWSWQSTTNAAISASVVTQDISAVAAGLSNVMVRFVFANGDGIASTWSIDDVRIYDATGMADTVAPVVSSFTVPATSATLAVSSIIVTATDNIAVTGYLLSESAAMPLATDTGWAVASPAAYTFPTWGNHTLYAYAKDAAGNISVVKSAPVFIGSKPDVDGVVVPAPATDPPKLEPQLSDALKSLSFAMKVETPMPIDILHGDVAPLVNGVPQPDGEINLGDTIVTLRRVVGL